MIDISVTNIGDTWFGVAYEGEKIFATNFASSEKSVFQGLLKSIPFNAPFQRLETASEFAEHALTLLKDIYDGKDVSIDLSLAMEHLSNYTRKVLKVASLIPLGYVTSYGSLAKAVGGSPRGVGRVMSSNPFAPIVPCHRVVGSDFSLVGYGGGLGVKLAFLKRESRGFASAHEIRTDDGRLQVFPAELVFTRARE